MPSGVVKQQYQYGEFGLRVSDDMRIKQVGTIVGTFYGVRQVLMCLFSNIIGYLGVLNRYEGSIPFTRSTSPPFSLNGLQLRWSRGDSDSHNGFNELHLRSDVLTLCSDLCASVSIDGSAVAAAV